MGKLTIQEVAKVLVEKNGLAQHEANNFVTTLFAIIHERLQQGEQVKVKGLGTFKMVSVEARESVSVRTGERVVIDSHSKVSFTPDATMKELVNRPFSQFETVVLNDGVEFEDLKDDLPEETAVMASAQEPEMPVIADAPGPSPQSPLSIPPRVEDVAAHTAISNYASPSEEDDRESLSDESVDSGSLSIPPRDEDVAAHTAISNYASPLEEDDREALSDESVDSAPLSIPPRGEDVAVHSAISNYASPSTEDEGESLSEEDERRTSPGRWALLALAAIGLMAAAAFGGYQYGRMQPPLVVADTIRVNDTVFLAELADTSYEDLADAAAPSPLPISPQGEGVNAHTAESNYASPSEKDGRVALSGKDGRAAGVSDPYAQKDERVRLGAYRIVGTKEEVTVLAGQTFYSICRAHLGPDMQCYVEVYNNLPPNPQVKAGQVLKIPQLELKKKRK